VKTDIHSSINTLKRFDVIHHNRAGVRQLHVPRVLFVATFTHTSPTSIQTCLQVTRNVGVRARSINNLRRRVCPLSVAFYFFSRKRLRVTNYTTGVVVRVAFSVESTAQPWARTTRTCSTTTVTRWRSTTAKTTSRIDRITRRIQSTAEATARSPTTSTISTT